MDKRTQMKLLLKLLETTPTLTVQYIIEKLKINSPRKVISDLRDRGVPVEDRWVDHIDAYGSYHRYKEYWIRKEWFEK